MSPVRLLLAEDDRIVRITVRDALVEAGYQVVESADGVSALRLAEAQPFDMVLSDVRLPNLDGIALFRRIRELQTHAAVVLMTAHADTDAAVTVIREGVRDYILKPFEIDELLLRLDRVRQELEFRRELELGGRSTRAPHPIKGVSLAVQRLLEQVDAAAASDVSVLLVGETGTGKDLCARTIHEHSGRAGRPFIAVNCAALPDNLVESEFFGHEKGAFTGADRRRVGRFEAANGGTLFLDEVGELSLGSQVKLLRALETSQFEPVGSSKTVTVDVRIIAATNRELSAEIARSSFRKDLYYRLNVIEIETPSLRARRADIPILVHDFLEEIAARQGRPPPALDPSAVAALAAYDFPGNVRELIHALERAVAMSRGGVLRVEHLPAQLAAAGLLSSRSTTGAAASGEVQPLAAAVAQFEQQYIRRVLDKVDGHRGRAAALLGISRKNLWEKLKE